MTDHVATAAPAAASGSDSGNVFSRLFGVLTSPRETFAGIVARPRWLAAMAIVALFIAFAQYAFLSTQVGQDAMVDQQMRQTERWTGNLTQEQIDGIERRAPMGKYFALGATLIFVPVISFIVAGILFGVFNALLGGDASYKQVLAINAHAGAVSLVQTLFVVPLNYFRESLSSATNLGVFVQFLDDTNYVARVLGWFDLFIIWNLIVTAIGLSVLYKRKTAPIFWSFMAIYAVIALVGAALMKG
jgi:hypothetical protein